MQVIKQLITAAAFASIASGALAQEATPDTWLNVGGAKTRAEVHADLMQAQHDGSVRSSTEGYGFVGKVATIKTRDQVRAELLAARASGEYDVLNREGYAMGPIRGSSAYAKARSSSIQ